MIDKDYIKALKPYIKRSDDYAGDLAKEFGISKDLARSIIITGWRRILRMMTFQGRFEFKINGFGHIYVKKNQGRMNKQIKYEKRRNKISPGNKTKGKVHTRAKRSA